MQPYILWVMTLSPSGHHSASRLDHSHLFIMMLLLSNFSLRCSHQYAVWDLLVAETNLYTHYRLCNPPSRHGILHNWHDTCREEMMSFIGLILTMGIVQLSEFKGYWRRHRLSNCPALSGTVPLWRKLSRIPH